MSGVLGAQVPPGLREAMAHAERLCVVVSRLEERFVSEVGRAWLIGRREEIEKVLSLVMADWSAKRRTDEEARLSVLEYVDELHVAAARLFGVEAPTRHGCFGDVVATEPMDLQGATRQVELPRAAPLSSSDTAADPIALGKLLKVKA